MNMSYGRLCTRALIERGAFIYTGGTFLRSSTIWPFRWAKTLFSTFKSFL